MFCIDNASPKRILLGRRSGLVAFRNTKSLRYSEVKQTRSSTKKEFSGKALSKQKIKAYLVSLSCNLPRLSKLFKRATRNGDANNHIAVHHQLTNHNIDRDSAQCLTYSTNCFQRLTVESWYTNFKQTHLNRCQQLPARYKRQEPITRSLQLPYIPVTAFSQTDLFLARINLKFRSPQEPH